MAFPGIGILKVFLYFVLIVGIIVKTSRTDPVYSMLKNKGANVANLWSDGNTARSMGLGEMVLSANDWKTSPAHP